MMGKDVARLSKTIGGISLSSLADDWQVELPYLCDYPNLNTRWFRNQGFFYHSTRVLPPNHCAEKSVLPLSSRERLTEMCLHHNIPKRLIIGKVGGKLRATDLGKNRDAQGPGPVACMIRVWSVACMTRVLSVVCMTRICPVVCMTRVWPVVCTASVWPVGCMTRVWPGVCLTRVWPVVCMTRVWPVVCMTMLLPFYHSQWQTPKLLHPLKHQPISCWPVP